MIFGHKHISKETVRSDTSRACQYCARRIEANTDYVLCHARFDDMAFEWNVHKECDRIVERLGSYAKSLGLSNTEATFHNVLDRFCQEYACNDCPDKREDMGQLFCSNSSACIQRASSVLKGHTLVGTGNGKFRLIDDTGEDV